MRCRLMVTGILALAMVGCAASRPKPAEPVADPNPPKTLEEALDRLQQMLPPATLQKMGDGSEREMALYHMGLGLWMRNNWGLWSQDALYEHFAGLGLQHPDDMSGLILTCLWRRLHDEPLRVENEVAHYQEYWRLARDPDPQSNPACSGSIETTLSWGLESKDPLLRGVHMGKCCGDGAVWSYQVDRGWYRPTESELAQWNEDDGRYDPCRASGAVEQGVEADEAGASDGASQLNSSVRRPNGGSGEHCRWLPNRGGVLRSGDDH